MICVTVSDQSLLPSLELRFSEGVSVSLLAELERELLRLRHDFSFEEWAAFCVELPNRRLFEHLRLGSLTRRRLSTAQACLPPDLVDVISADAFQARPTAAACGSHLISAWEYSLPISRSMRSRKAYFAREISSVLEANSSARILILGAGHGREAEEWIRRESGAARFVAVEPDASLALRLAREHRGKPLEVTVGDWGQLASLASEQQPFDLIYSVCWLDCLDDQQALQCLTDAVHLLRPGGRILAANCAPGSRDAGWMEACWNWHPHYRSEERLARLAMELKQPETCAVIRGYAVFRDESGASAYLEIHSI